MIKFITPPSPNLNLSRKIEELLKMLGPGAKVLDLGSGTRRRAEHIINIDCFELKDVDIVGDAHALPLKEGCIDAVIAQALIEHVKDPVAVVSEIRRSLKKDGYVYAEIPFLQPFHAAPADYRRFTLAGIEDLFAGFKKIETGVCVGPTSAVFGMLMEYIPFVIGIPVLRAAVYLLLGWIFFPVRYLDMLLIHKQKAHYFSSSLYFFGRK